MSGATSIEWTDAVWNVLRGCTRVSEGCRNCYAERTAVRQIATGYAGLVKSTPTGPRWTGEVRFVEKLLDQPLRWRAPRRIFVNSMSDLFHEKVNPNDTARIFAVMALAHWHTFQVLTKRPEQMQSLFRIGLGDDVRQEAFQLGEYRLLGERLRLEFPWPLPNVHLGVSVEDQATADERIPLLLGTPAAVHWVSYEPALGPVDFTRITEYGLDALHGVNERRIKIGWLVCGGESGPGARPFDLAWARSTIARCRAAGVPVFVKQLGAVPITHGLDASSKYAETVPHERGDRWLFRDRKGGDWSEWPEDLRVREFPRGA